ncbi:MAG: carboxypeptidase-like regulatory domain-containing protein [Acidobacteriota bacterium]|jgi:hypothetical protein
MGPRISGSIAVVAVSLLTLVVGAPAVVAQAPGWSGTSGVGVKVEDGDGRAVAGAEVRLTFSGEGGPRPVFTDADGRAEVRGLAPGEWVLTVRHPETMAFVATLTVRENRKPKEIAASLVKVGKSLESLRIDYFEASGPALRPPPPPMQEEQPPRRAEPRPEPEPEPRAEQEPAPEPDEPAAAPPEEAPEEAPAVAPEERPVAPPEQEPEPRAEQGPAPEPTPEAPAEPAMERPETEQEPAPPPQPEPIPEPPTAERAPEPMPEPARPAAPPRQVTLRSEEAGTCPECQPGEWALSTQGVAAPEGTICPGDLEDRIRRAAGLLGASRALGPWAGPIDLAGGASSVLGGQAYREFTAALRPVLADDASCRALAVMLPSGARFEGFQYETADGDTWIRCLPGQECPGAGQRWAANPLLIRTPAGMVIAGAFENAGPEPLPVRLTVFFSPPEGWKPR